MELMEKVGRIQGMFTKAHMLISQKEDNIPDDQYLHAIMYMKSFFYGIVEYLDETFEVGYVTLEEGLVKVESTFRNQKMIISFGYTECKIEISNHNGEGRTMLHCKTYAVASTPIGDVTKTFFKHFERLRKELLTTS